MNENRYLVVSPGEMERRGWHQLDVLLLTGDAYVDHPSFPGALIGRVLEERGFRVGIFSRPDIKDEETLRAFGVPRLFAGVTAGALDSMVANYTALRRRRRDDPYAPGGKAGGRPDRAVTAYANWLRRVWGKYVVIVGGGIEASLRRFAHYDYWSDSVRRSILVDAPLDLVVHSMAEKTVVAVARALDQSLESQRPMSRQDRLKRLRSLPGIAYRLESDESPPGNAVVLPDWEAIRSDKQAHLDAWKIQEKTTDRVLTQRNGNTTVVVNPRSSPLTSKELDALYRLPFVRSAHPMYRGQPVPASKQVQFSITSHRGCAGGCAFCAIHAHQGKEIRSRSRQGILEEIGAMTRHPDFDGTIRDVGGPSANMFGARCTRKEPCNRVSCLHPRRCPHFETAQEAYASLLKQASKVPGVKHLFVTTGLRLDLALECPDLVVQVAHNHTSGHLKIAPEHTQPNVLRQMRKPGGRDFEAFVDLFREQSRQASRNQFVIPYVMAAHPGSRLEDMVKMAAFLAQKGIRTDQCQIFTPTPGTASTVMYATGLDPATGKPLYVERSDSAKRLQKAILLYHLPENQDRIRTALKRTGREDLSPAFGLHKSRRKRR